MEHNVRVFISYSHEDLKLVERLVAILEQNGIMVLWTKTLAPGSGYEEQLKIFIEHAHIFMPVITASSSARGWVHQEIGYAIALHIPVFPVTIGKFIPIGMLEYIQAIQLDENDQNMTKQISYRVLSALMQKEALPALYQRAAKVEERAALMKLYSDKVSGMEKFGMVRQKGGLSSFHIPINTLDIRFGQTGTRHKLDEEIEQISQWEHARWNWQKILQGWVYGPKKDEAQKTNPYILPWNQLPDNIKEYDRENVRLIPEFIQEAGYNAVRKPT